MKLSELKPKFEFPLEFTKAETKKTNELIGKIVEIKKAISYSKRDGDDLINKVALLIVCDGKTYAIYTQSKSIVEIGDEIAKIGDDFDGVTVKFVSKVSKNGKPYIDVEEV